MADEKPIGKAGLAHLWSKIKTMLEGKAAVNHQHSYAELNDRPDIPTITLISWTTDDME